MYVHVPAAWLSLGIFSIISILSFCIFIFKIKHFSLIAKSLAPSGFLFSVIALVTGSIWENQLGEHGGRGMRELHLC